MKLRDILTELRQYNNHDKDAIMNACIQKRLNDSAKSYYDELQHIEKHLLNSMKSSDSLKEIYR